MANSKEETMFFGIVLIIIGALLLLNEMGIIHWSFWGYIWPVLIIAVGLRMIVGEKTSKKKEV
jgi:predicted membrane protein